MYWTFGAVFAAIAGVLMFLGQLLLGKEGDKSPVSAFLFTGFLSLLVNVGVMWQMMPSFIHPLDPAAGTFGLIFLDLILGALVTAIIAGIKEGGWGALGFAIVALLVWFFGFTIVSNFMVTPGTTLLFACDNAGNKQMTRLLSVQDVSTNDILEENDPTHLIRVSPDDALTKARGALSGGEALGSYFEIDREYLKRVKGHAYWIVSFRASSWQALDKYGGFIPGYILVDAEDKDRRAELKLGYKMSIVPGAKPDHDLVRYVYEHYSLGRGVLVQDLNGLEVDDDLNPKYTGTVVAPVIGFKGKSVSRVLVLDPQNGQIEDYELGHEPSWVKRVFPTELLVEQASWWGKYIAHDDCPWQGEAGIRKVDHASDVTTRSGSQEVQISFTSTNPKDFGLTDLLVVDAKTGRARRATKVFGETPEKVAQAIAQRSKEIGNIEHDVASIQLEVLLGHQVWFAILQTKTTTSTNGTTLGISVDGYALLRRDLPSETGNVIVGRTVNEVYDKLRGQIADQAKKDTSMSQEQKKLQITGHVGRKNPLILAGKTYFVFNLTGDQVPPKARFRVSADIYEAAQMQTGDLVTVTVYETKVEDYYDVLDIFNQTFQSLHK